MIGKVYYIDFIQNEMKVGNMGVIREDIRGFSCVIHLPRQFHKMKCEIYAQTGQGQSIYLTDVFVMQGRGQVRYDIDVKQMQQWEKIKVHISPPIYGICVLQNVENISSQEENAIVAEIKMESEKVEERIKAQEEKDTFIENLPSMKNDKWEQLRQVYSQVHIFPDAETIVIKPKDMIVLTKEYQDLMTNSFVLHAYYNYRQLLLIRYQNKSQKQYYIGVPGIYFEREKRVAMLFGFEGFENGEAKLAQASGKGTYIGCFGYYVKQVEI